MGAFDDAHNFAHILDAGRIAAGDGGINGGGDLVGGDSIHALGGKDDMLLPHAVRKVAREAARDVFKLREYTGQARYGGPGKRGGGAASSLRMRSITQVEK